MDNGHNFIDRAGRTRGNNGGTDDAASTSGPPTPRRVPFWDLGSSPDMAAALSDCIGELMPDEHFRPIALYALRSKRTAHVLGGYPHKHKWTASTEDVLKFLADRGGRCFQVYGGSRCVVWEDGLARVHGLLSGEVHGLSLATCDKELLDAVEKAREGWLRRIPEGPTATSVSVLAKDINGRFSTMQIATETSALVEENYDGGVVAAYHRALAALRAKTPPGRLLVLEGATGTGKTHLVRALLGALEGSATVLLVPEHLVASLGEPAIVPTLVALSAKGPIVLVLEDCDDCLLSREHASSQGDRANVATLSAVLNLADGILGAALNLRLIATTNARVEHMDSALLRPGRLIERIVVGPLQRERALSVIARVAGVGDGRAGVVAANAAAFDRGFHGPSLTLAEAYSVARSILARRAEPPTNGTANSTPDTTTASLS